MANRVTDSIEANSITTGVVASFYGVLSVDANGCGTQLGFGQQALVSLAPAPTLLDVVGLSGGQATPSFAIPGVASAIGVDVTVRSVVVDTTTFASEFSTGPKIAIRP